MTKNETYREICKVVEEIRNIRKRYTTFASEPTLSGMVHKLITCEEGIEEEARKYCS